MAEWPGYPTLDLRAVGGLSHNPGAENARKVCQHSVIPGKKGNKNYKACGHIKMKNQGHTP